MPAGRAMNGVDTTASGTTKLAATTGTGRADWAVGHRWRAALPWQEEPRWRSKQLIPRVGHEPGERTATRLAGRRTGVPGMAAAKDGERPREQQRRRRGHGLPGIGRLAGLLAVTEQDELLDHQPCQQVSATPPSTAGRNRHGDDPHPARHAPWGSSMGRSAPAPHGHGSPSVVGGRECSTHLNAPCRTARRLDRWIACASD